MKVRQSGQNTYVVRHRRHELRTFRFFCEFAHVHKVDAKEQPINSQAVLTAQ